MTIALAAIAPVKPATKDVHPVRNAASRPNAAFRYTYSPPARGRSAASSAYAIAPARASAPPASHAPRNQNAFGTAAATCGGVNRIPPPMTFAMMMAAASRDPRRRSKDGVADDSDMEASSCQLRASSWELLREKFARNRPFAKLDPLIAALLDEHLHTCVDELLVLEHLRARFDPCVPQVRSQRDRPRRRARRQSIGAHDFYIRPAPLFRVAGAPDHRIELQIGDRLASGILQREDDR